MKTLHLLIGLLTCGLLSGCAHDQSKPVSSNVSQPEHQVVVGQSASFVVTNTGTAPLTYQWHFRTNIQSETIRPAPNTASGAGNPDGSWQLYIVDETNNPSK